MEEAGARRAGRPFQQEWGATTQAKMRTSGHCSCSTSHNSSLSSFKKRASSSKASGARKKGKDIEEESQTPPGASRLEERFDEAMEHRRPDLSESCGEAG